jgi:hypothetical protein
MLQLNQILDVSKIRTRLNNSKLRLDRVKLDFFIAEDKIFFSYTEWSFNVSCVL